jgi:hypothetical protein
VTHAENDKAAMSAAISAELSVCRLADAAEKTGPETWRSRTPARTEHRAADA